MEMAQNEKLAELSSAGVAVWLDDLSRDRIRSGNLQSLVDEYSVVGVTTNPTIFAAAISGSESYDDQLHALAVREVSLAHDTDATAAEAAHLWWLVDRPNLFIKIPATEAGLPAITTSIARGISVNVTLIFSLERYRAVMDAYLSGLEQRLAEDADADLSGIASVASFFVSRVDSEIDKRLEKAGADPALKGKAALANAQLAYQAYEEVFSSDRWKALEAKGARPQRPLWASTGVKNPDYPDTLYVSELVAPGTVNTMPEKTLKAFADHGSIGTPVQKTYDEAASVMRSIADAGVDLDDVFRVLEDEGVQKFADSWDELTESVRTELEDKA
jgi:transaldolase